MGPMRKPERETWAGTVGEEILEEGAVPTEQWRVGTIWRDRKKWERNSKWCYQVHEWRHTSRDKHAGPLEFILDSNSCRGGIRGTELTWKGQLRQGKDTNGRQSASQSCSPHSTQRAGNVCICALPRKTDSTTIHTHSTDLQGGMGVDEWALFWAHSSVLAFLHCSTHIRNAPALAWPIAPRSDFKWLSATLGRNVRICSVPASYCWLLQMSTKACFLLCCCYEPCLLYPILCSEGFEVLVLILGLWWILS